MKILIIVFAALAAIPAQAEEIYSCEVSAAWNKNSTFYNPVKMETISATTLSLADSGYDVRLQKLSSDEVAVFISLDGGEPVSESVVTSGGIYEFLSANAQVHIQVTCI